MILDHDLRANGIWQSTSRRVQSMRRLWNVLLQLPLTAAGSSATVPIGWLR
jgi:hypothetical protein